MTSLAIYYDSLFRFHPRQGNVSFWSSRASRKRKRTNSLWKWCSRWSQDVCQTAQGKWWKALEELGRTYWLGIYEMFLWLLARIDRLAILRVLINYLWPCLMTQGNYMTLIWSTCIVDISPAWLLHGKQMTLFEHGTNNQLWPKAIYWSPAQGGVFEQQNPVAVAGECG